MQEIRRVRTGSFFFFKAVRWCLLVPPYCSTSTGWLIGEYTNMNRKIMETWAKLFNKRIRIYLFYILIQFGFTWDIFYFIERSVKSLWFNNAIIKLNTHWYLQKSWIQSFKLTILTVCVKERDKHKSTLQRL